MEGSMKIPASVSAYVDECAAVLSWLSDDCWLGQDEFDRLSNAWRRSIGARVHDFTPETIVPPMVGDLNLAILHEFQRAALVDARTRDGRIEYRLAEKATGRTDQRFAQNPALFSEITPLDEGASD
jgi:hypothetical protein